MLTILKTTLAVGFFVQ